ncbi:MAG: sulfatase family protein [Armatimonadota bacterium]
MTHPPNLLFVFGDQWRAQACGYAGDPNVQTPSIDAFARQSVNLRNAVSGYPVCSPYRASLLTGQYPLTHGMIANDQRIAGNPVCFADALDGAGYDTAYIGKWHVHGPKRSAFIEPQFRRGFKQWLGFECTHTYNESHYYADTPEKRQWEGYDAEAQTGAACRYLRERAGKTEPFALFLSWGPPHDPYHTAPERFRALYRPQDIRLRLNVPEEAAARARETLSGYYAHCTALDTCFGTLLDELERAGLAEDTIVVFTSDHGDMHGSHGLWMKQWPHEESIRVPFLLRWPAGLGDTPREVTPPLNAPDVMPTLLGLCTVPIPGTVEGCDFSPAIRGEEEVDDDGAYLACFVPFHQFQHANGGRDYRGLRTECYTYVRDHAGPWLLFDNDADPYQLHNLAGNVDLCAQFEEKLQRKLKKLNDPFAPGCQLLRHFNVQLNEAGDVYYDW